MDSAATRIAPACVTPADSPIAARVVVSSTATETVPPTAVEPLAEASVFASTSTVFDAASPSVPPERAEVVPSTSTVALLSTITTATPASPGRLTKSGSPGRAFAVTEDTAESVASPPAARLEAPRTLTAASTSTSTVPTGETLGVEESTRALAWIASVPVASTVVESRSISARTPFATIGEIPLAWEEEAVKVTFRPLTVAPARLIAVSVAEKTSSSPPLFLASSTMSPAACPPSAWASSLLPACSEIVGACNVRFPESPAELAVS